MVRHRKLLRFARRLLAGALAFVAGLVATTVKSAGEATLHTRVGQSLDESAQLFMSPGLWRATFATLRTNGIVIALVLLIGSALALTIFRLRWAASLETVIRFLRPIPAVAMIALGVLLLSSTSKYLGVFVAFIGALWPFTVSLLDTFRAVPQSFRESAVTLGKSEAEYLTQVLAPAALRGFFSSFRLIVPITLLLTVTTEYFFHNLSGLGSLLYEKQAGLEYPAVFSLVAFLAVLGWSLEISVIGLEGRIVKWGPDVHRDA